MYSVLLISCSDRRRGHLGEKRQRPTTALPTLDHNDINEAGKTDVKDEGYGDNKDDDVNEDDDDDGTGERQQDQRKRQTMPAHMVARRQHNNLDGYRGEKPPMMTTKTTLSQGRRPC